MLVLCVLAVLLWGTPARAQEAALAVGQVRDTQGVALVGARVTALGAAGATVGEGAVDPAGSFAFEVRAPALRLRVRCAYCRPAGVAYHAGDIAIIIVARYHAVARLDPSPADYAALPYDRLADAIALRPYVVELTRGARVLALSDRGLNAGHGLLLDSGISAYDRSDGTMNLWSFPARYVAGVHVADAEQAYRYGSYAGGGTFSVDAIGAGASGVRVNGGATQDARVSALTGASALLFGASNDGVQTAARSDARTQFRLGNGGLTLAGALARSAFGVPREFVHWSSRAASARYATAFGPYRAEAGFAIDSGETVASARDAWSGNALHARITRAGAVSLEAGYVGRRTKNDTGAGAIPTQAQNEIYLHAASGLASTHIDAALAAFSLAVPGAQAFAVTPQLAVDQDLSAGFRLHLAAVGSLQAAPPLVQGLEYRSGLHVLRDTIYTGELQWTDVRRLRAAFTLFSEAAGGAARRYGGWGARLAFQVTPEVAVRTWALRGTTSFSGGAYDYAVPGPGEAGAAALTAREVVWLTYDRPSGVRFDLVYARNGGPGTSRRHVDADMLIPIAPLLRLYTGTSYVNQQRRYEFGLRF